MAAPVAPRVEYGAKGTFVDVSHVYAAACAAGEPVFIPPTDIQRAKLFGVDPLYGVVKSVLVSLGSDGTQICYVPAGRPLLLMLDTATGMYKQHSGAVGACMTDAVLRTIHASLAFSWTLGVDCGGLEAEMPEQRMIVRAVRPDARVLEIGANTGRSTCVLCSVLNSSSQLTTIESDASIAQRLTTNCIRNGFEPAIIVGALSKTPLQQSLWTCKPLPVTGLDAGYHAVETFTFEQLLQRASPSSLPFDTLFADCEGALAPILTSYPQLLSGINTVIIENDFKDAADKLFVDKLFEEAGLQRVYTEELHGHLDEFPYCSCFFQIWQKGG